MHLVDDTLQLNAHYLLIGNQIVNCFENPTLQRCIFCDTHGCKVDLVNATIHRVDDMVNLVMTVCILSVASYVLNELIGAMDG